MLAVNEVIFSALSYSPTEFLPLNLLLRIPIVKLT